jgi:hypothetical protein
MKVIENITALLEFKIKLILNGCDSCNVSHNASH